jgi:hypothetical protein
MKKPKYTTITELATAFKCGELDSSYYVIMDKGGCEISLRQSGEEEGESERYDKCREIFQRSYGCPMQELMTLAGIKSEWC